MPYLFDVPEGTALLWVVEEWDRSEIEGNYERTCGENKGLWLGCNIWEKNFKCKKKNLFPT